MAARDPAACDAPNRPAHALVSGRRGAVLALDEIQKIPGWSETVKRLWDADTASGLPLHLVVLGSAPLLLQRRLGESLAGRFEMLHVPHWSFAETHAAFRFDPDQYVYFGGYPGAASLIDDPVRWMRYVRDSLVETTISRDVRFEVADAAIRKDPEWIADISELCGHLPLAPAHRRSITSLVG